MKKIIVLSIAFFIIAAWIYLYGYPAYLFRQVDLEYIAESKIPRMQLDFWNKTSSGVQIKIDYVDENPRWIILTHNGGSFGTYPAGKFDLEFTIQGGNVFKMENLQVGKDVELTFNIYEDHAEQINQFSNIAHEENM